MIATIDGALIGNRDALHDALIGQLALPEWYGRNLDALYDCLTDLAEDTEIRILRRDELFAHLGVYADVLQSVVRDACENNPLLHLTIVETDNRPNEDFQHTEREGGSGMKTKCILFDMDGTLLPMDSGVFAKTYFKVLTKKMSPYGYEPNTLIDGINAGITATQTNDGTHTNEELFWEHFVEVCGQRALKDRALFDEFYAVDFQRISSTCGYTPEAKATIALCKELGYPVVIATEPIFPLCAMESRLRWAGVDPSAAEFITSYETSHYCKPDLGYYREVADRLGVQPEECAMVGNDVGEDMPAAELGMKVFLLTDCLINKEKADIAQWPHGSFGALQRWLRELD